MKQINTLVKDMYDVVDGKITEYVSDHLSDFGAKLEKVYNERLKYREDGDRKDRVLRLSSMGNPCVRKLWYEANSDHPTELIGPATRLKFFFGDVLEEILLQLARDAGHDVQGEQDRLEFNGVVGHRDAVIDGVTIDCKSASSFSFEKFRKGLSPDTDSFGYLSQLGSYVYAGRDDPIVTDKERGGFLAIDKQHGHICLDLHYFHYPEKMASDFDYIKTAVNNPDVVPPRGFKDVEDGKSGNRKLGTVCSYCHRKHECWDNIRTFIYSSGPRFLTRTVKLPNVPEAKQ